MSTNAGEVKAAVEKAVNEFAGRGFRSLGVARADEEGKWQFAAVLPLFDPPREQAKATIASAREMGVKIKMVTGDQIAIARETSKQLGLGTNILNASVFGDMKAHETAQASEAIEKADGFAQVFPEHKFHIVDVLQQRVIHVNDRLTLSVSLVGLEFKMKKLTSKAPPVTQLDRWATLKGCATRRVLKHHH